MDTLLNLLLVGGLIFVMMRFGCGAHAGRHAGHGAPDHPGGCCGGHGHDRNPAPKEKEGGTHHG